MKAVILTKYGSPDVLRLEEVETPTPKENEVLIKIHATAVNDYDWSLVRGKPHLYRLMFGFAKPKIRIPGMELAGTVAAVGTNAKAFAVGDAVYGDISDYGFGTFAEYICINERAMTHKPPEMSFEEAAAIPHAALLALQGLVDVGEIQKGQKVLINGAGGGVGTFGLQIAKEYDAEVTGVDTGPKLEMMQAIGFDHIIDYRKEDFTRSGQRYDLILDAKTNRPTSHYLRALAPGGRYVTVGGSLPRLLQALVLKPWISRFSHGDAHILALKANKGLAYINELYEAGKIKPVIDGPFQLNEAVQALRRFGEAKHTGKVIIAVV
jgi:NADPH:quinone reductase-like Zn-dependent oxidoreductase